MTNEDRRIQAAWEEFFWSAMSNPPRDTSVAQQLAAAQERIAALKTVLHQLYDLAYERAFDYDHGYQTRSRCLHCGRMSNLDERVEHEDGCFVEQARKLLKEPK